MTKKEKMEGLLEELDALEEASHTAAEEELLQIQTELEGLDREIRELSGEADYEQEVLDSCLCWDCPNG